MENENQKTDVIYILLSQSKKLFMILRGCKDSIRETYRHHLKGRRLTTESFIKSISPERPCLFILEEIDSEEEANLLIVWLKILLDQGYVSCNHPDIIEQTEHLYIDNLRAYNKRKATDLSTLLACKRCPIPIYKRRLCSHYPFSEEDAVHRETALQLHNYKNKKSHEVRFCVSDEEKKKIEANAAKMKMQVSAYVRMVAQNPVVRSYDYSIICAHTREIGEIRTCINRLIYTIELTNNYLPREIETILDLMKKIFEGENRLLKAIRKQQ